VGHTKYDGLDEVYSPTALPGKPGSDEKILEQVRHEY
jgi:hypothetical protein